MAALLGQPWQESTLQSALAALRQDVNVAPTAPGGRGEYRNSLAASFLYKFYVHVSCLLLCFVLLCRRNAQKGQRCRLRQSRIADNAWRLGRCFGRLNMDGLLAPTCAVLC